MATKIAGALFSKSKDDEATQYSPTTAAAHEDIQSPPTEEVLTLPEEQPSPSSYTLDTLPPSSDHPQPVPSPSSLSSQKQQMSLYSQYVLPIVGVVFVSILIASLYVRKE